MSFQNRISAKRDPVEGIEAAERSVRPAQPVATLVLNGTFGAGAASDVLAELERLFTAGTDSVVVDMQEVSVADFERLRGFVAEVMELRSSSANVQIAVRDNGLHDMMRALPHARDWLLSKPDAQADGGRRGVHVDHPRPLRDN